MNGGLDDLLGQAGISGETSESPSGNTQAPAQTSEDTDTSGDAAQALQNSVINQYEMRRMAPRRPSAGGGKRIRPRGRRRI
jgi:hypothetical protein